MKLHELVNELANVLHQALLREHPITSSITVNSDRYLYSWYGAVQIEVKIGRMLDDNKGFDIEFTNPISSWKPLVLAYNPPTSDHGLLIKSYESLQNIAYYLATAATLWVDKEVYIEIEQRNKED